ncbi:hypothetical protein ACQKP0_03885 [Heyndrickxia sp. NPDC080065]|uniref:hypothetical protein n=1 Tax=Heyndrickxia sp. NPDC080065 TaxID=3390568 RepID=UPI003D08E9D2
MIFRSALKYISVLVFLIFSTFIYPSISTAENRDNIQQQAFSNFEKKIFEMIDSSMEPLNKLDKELDEESLRKIVLSAKQKFSENHRSFLKIKVPDVLSADIKASLEQIKDEFSTGFLVLQESMDYFAQYMENHSHLLLKKFMEKRNRGFLYIDGGLTSLATVRLRLDAPKLEATPNVWDVGKRHLYELPKKIPENNKAVPIKSKLRKSN